MDVMGVYWTCHVMSCLELTGGRGERKVDSDLIVVLRG